MPHMSLPSTITTPPYVLRHPQLLVCNSSCLAGRVAAAAALLQDPAASNSGKNGLLSSLHYSYHADVYRRWGLVDYLTKPVIACHVDRGSRDMAPQQLGNRMPPPHLEILHGTVEIERDGQRGAKDRRASGEQDCSTGSGYNLAPEPCPPR